MKKKILSLIFAAAMMMSLPAAAFAADAPTVPIDPIESSVADGGVSVMSVASSTVGSNRTSNTYGTVSAYAAFTKTATKATCAITLQEKYNGSWRTATGIPATSYIKTVSNSNSISFSKGFTLLKGKVYRARVIFTDTNSGGTYTQTRYTGSF